MLRVWAEKIRLIPTTILAGLPDLVNPLPGTGEASAQWVEIAGFFWKITRRWSPV
jgi:hypothetical protein